MGMICNFPSPTLLCPLRQTRKLMPSLVVEFIGAVRQSAPHQGRIVSTITDDGTGEAFF